MWQNKSLIYCFAKIGTSVSEIFSYAKIGTYAIDLPSMVYVTIIQCMYVFMFRVSEFISSIVFRTQRPLINLYEYTWIVKMVK